MTIPELKLEHKKMAEAIDRLKDTDDPTVQFQLVSARALKFALECQMKARADKLTAPTPRDGNVLDFAQYKRFLEARNMVELSKDTNK